MAKKRKQHSPTVRLSLPTATTYAGTPVTIGIAVNDVDGNLASGSLDWGDGSGTSWTVVAPTSLVHTYAAAGSYTIRATVQDTLGMIGSTTASITVQPPTPLPSVFQTDLIEAGPSSGTTGQALGYSATAKFSDGTQQNVTASAVWLSTNTAVATVAAGAVTTIAAGTTIIRTSYGGYTKDISLTVSAPAPTPPATPNSPSPADLATDVSLTPTLHWASAGASTYAVAFGTVNPPPPVTSGLGTTAYQPGSLINSTLYYWQITATNAGGSTVGPVWRFTTQAAALTPSPDPTFVPPSGQIVDNNLDVWTLGTESPVPFIYRNGVQVAGGSGFAIAWCGNTIYVLGSDQVTWWQWTGVWSQVGTTNPCAPPPPPVPTDAIYISTSGNDSTGNGTIGNPYQTFAKGLSLLAGSGTLVARGAPTVAGIYAEAIHNQIPSGTAGAYTRVQAYPGETVWLTPTSGQGGDRAFYVGGDIGDPVVNPQYIELDGINIDASNMLYGAIVYDDRNGSNPNHLRVQRAWIKNRDGDGGGGAAINVGAAHGSVHTVTDNEFLSLEVTGTSGAYGIYITGDRNTVDGCHIHDVSNLGIQTYRNGGNPIGNTIRNCRIHAVHEVNSPFFGRFPDTRVGGILLAGDDHLVVQNVIYDCRARTGTPEPVGGVLSYTGQRHRVYNNTVYDVDGPAYHVAPGAAQADYRNNVGFGCDANGIQDDGSGTTKTPNIFTDPLFINAAGADFHVQNGSPAIDSGVTLPVASPDPDGVTRPQRLAYDCGAYEKV